MIGKDVPIPPRMQALEKDHRGYPIPANVLRDVTGLPVFTVNNAAWVYENQMVAEVCRCSLCGQPIEPGTYNWIGGPVSAFHPHGAYADGPVHHECGTYALQVCPYLALPKSRYKKRLDDKAAKNPLPVNVTIDVTQYADKPPCYILAQSVGFSLTFRNAYNDHRFLPISNPVEEMSTLGHIMAARFERFECWVDAEPVHDEEETYRLIIAGMEVAKQAPQPLKVQRVAEHLDGTGR